MMKPLFIAASILALLPWIGRDPDVSTHRVGHWTLTASTDRFSKSTDCKIINKDISIINGVALFHFAKTTDTSQAIYKIDEEGPFSAADDELAVAHAGLSLYSDDLTNTSGGVVRLPASKISNAHRLRIELAPHTKPRTFDVSGVKDVIELARQFECKGYLSGAKRP